MNGTHRTLKSAFIGIGFYVESRTEWYINNVIWSFIEYSPNSDFLQEYEE